MTFRKLLSFFKKRCHLLRKFFFLTVSIVLIRKKTLNTLSPFYQYPDRFPCAHGVQPVWTSFFKWNPPLCRSPPSKSEWSWGGAEADSRPCQKSKMELFAKIFDSRNQNLFWQKTSSEISDRVMNTPLRRWVTFPNFRF